MIFELPKVYPITDVRLSGLSHHEQVLALAKAGCRFLQIREKHATSRVHFEAISQSLAIAREFGAKIIVNDRVDIALAADADGVHLGQTDLPVAEARKLLGDNAIIGRSTHSVEQAVAASRESVNYIAIGPIFETDTKADTDALVGIEGIREVRNVIGEIPLVAIGGITRTNIGEVLSAGADSAAVISEIFAGIGSESAGAIIAARFTAIESATVKHF